MCIRDSRVSDQKARHYTDMGLSPWFIPEPWMKRGCKNLIPSKSHQCGSYYNYESREDLPSWSQCGSYQNHESKEGGRTYLPEVVSAVHTRTMNQKRVYELTSWSHQCGSYKNHESKEAVQTYLPEVVSAVHTRTMNQKRVYEPTFLKSSVRFIPEP